MTRMNNDAALSVHAKQVFYSGMMLGFFYVGLITLHQAFIAAFVISIVLQTTHTERRTLPRSKVVKRDNVVVKEGALPKNSAAQPMTAKSRPVPKCPQPFRLTNEQSVMLAEIKPRERKKVTRINAEFYRPEISLQRFAPSSDTAVVGVGCAGINTVDFLVQSGVRSADTIVIDTDLQTLHRSKADCALFIGDQKDQVESLVQQSLDQIQSAYQQADTLIVLTGMGGKTGTVVAPLLAKTAKERGKVVHLFAIEPFAIEGQAKTDLSTGVLDSLRGNLDSVESLSNEDLLSSFSGDQKLVDAFAEVNEVLAELMKRAA